MHNGHTDIQNGRPHAGAAAELGPGSGAGLDVSDARGGGPGSAAHATPPVCPYCGARTDGEGDSCESCGGLFEPLSRQATQNTMGPWSVRQEGQPFLPGCSLSVIRSMARRGRLQPDSVVRGPTTHQFWTQARRVPGVAHLLGLCHVCGAQASAEMTSCGECGASFEAPTDRQHLGLGPVRLLPGQASPEAVAGLEHQSEPTRWDAVRGRVSGAREEAGASRAEVEGKPLGAGRAMVAGGGGGGAAAGAGAGRAASPGDGDDEPGELVDAGYARRLERRLRAQKHQTAAMLAAAVLLALLSLGLWIGPRLWNPQAFGVRPLESAPRDEGAGANEAPAQEASFVPDLAEGAAAALEPVAAVVSDAANAPVPAEGAAADEWAKVYAEVLRLLSEQGLAGLDEATGLIEEMENPPPEAEGVLEDLLRQFQRRGGGASDGSPEPQSPGGGD